MTGNLAAEQAVIIHADGQFNNTEARFASVIGDDKVLKDKAKALGDVSATNLQLSRANVETANTNLDLSRDNFLDLTGGKSFPLLRGGGGLKPWNNF